MDASVRAVWLSTGGGFTRPAFAALRALLPPPLHTCARPHPCPPCLRHPRRVLVLPQGACNDWLGLAVVGGWDPANPASSDSTVWLNGGWREGVLAPYLHMHELGHNIHLGHSGYTFPDGVDAAGQVVPGWQDDYGDQASCAPSARCMNPGSQIGRACRSCAAPPQRPCALCACWHLRLCACLTKQPTLLCKQTCMMGGWHAPKCYNAPHQWQLGWSQGFQARASTGVRSGSADAATCRGPLRASHDRSPPRPAPLPCAGRRFGAARPRHERHHAGGAAERRTGQHCARGAYLASGLVCPGERREEA